MPLRLITMKTAKRKAHALLLLAISFMACPLAAPAQSSGADGLSLAPARVELEMQPGSETTFVVNLNYRAMSAEAAPSRLVASLNDWSLTPEGRLEFFRAGTQANSASRWIIYSPGEMTVAPGANHAIRVTVSVPRDAAPGDHLSALVVEPRPDNLRSPANRRQVQVRYRLAAMIYIKVAQLTRRGALQNLRAEAGAQGISITPTLRNTGNSVLRPTYAVKIVDAAGRIVVEITENESLPLLGGAELRQPLLLEQSLPPGSYSVSYTVDFQDGSRAIEGIAPLTVP